MDDFYYDDWRGVYEVIGNSEFLLSYKVKFDMKYKYQRNRFICMDFYILKNEIHEWTEEMKNDREVILQSKLKCKRIAGFVVGI